ncbi:hypothetical protein KUM39_25685 [Streptomyces sp. J2-1]|uniref:MHYT domain-containing protein n=1 Tax=Streptomyces corallincola TaxID=2851888 RepID=UPI001C38D1BC|nr:MHYT domain-containing protein [Streptomyces corallincola]MBV2357706.1 hypothetical protein [Streptomyces corallincola]
MQGTVDGFSYGIVTPLVAFVMACLGGALGLRCTARSQQVTRARRPVRLALGSAAIGSSVWTMHFVAMTGFTIEGTPIHYDMPITYASLGLAVVMVGVGICIVGQRGTRGTALFTGGTITGLGIASMHYLGMAGMQFDGRFSYDTATVVLSVAIAVVAATAALWASGQGRGLLWTTGASMVMGLAVTGMHYTGMAALDVHVHGASGGGPPGARGIVLAPMLIGPLVLLLLTGAAVLFDPLMVTGGPDRPVAETDRPGVPATAVPVRELRHSAPRPGRPPVGAGPRRRSRTPQNR